MRAGSTNTVVGPLPAQLTGKEGLSRMSDESRVDGPDIRRITRRRFLAASGAAAGLLVTSSLPVWATQARPAWSSRPQVTHGVQSGDVTTRSGIVWARADRPAHMIVEVDATERFNRAHRMTRAIATDATDFTAQVELHGLPSGQDIFYRIWFEDSEKPGLLSEPIVGRFRTAPNDKHDVSFVWSGDSAGQGWGINPEFGGMRIYETMRQTQPNFFIHSGDSIYADGPISAEVTLPDGSVWRNITTEEKSKVAETLDEFRGNYKYNLLDDNVRRFNAEVPIFAQWDDHETTNNWYPGEVLNDARYTVSDVNVLATRARRAFQEFVPLRSRPDLETMRTIGYRGSESGSHLPERIYRKIAYGPLLDVFFIDMRSYRGSNSENLQPTRSDATAILGAAQLKWLMRELKQSKATWKAIASDMPIGLVVRDGSTAFEAVANDNDAAPLGRELEIADLLSFIKQQEIANVVWFTADVHYTAAHHYDPAVASFTDFDPFWEFVSGPLNAGTFGPNQLDGTFGPTVVFQKIPDAPNLPPSAGLQFFGHVAIDHVTEVMTVRLKDLNGNTLYSVALNPARS